ncbi:aspartate aminotransferase family protein [Desmospora profundinema]|uniref:Glutamate-1-semialdehyde 2,1-aminomutase n=1 Tax=Desmospora profundinema TaxID=1571184 RepID=A0ABU1IK92_9BACL|nr:aspartate aminotransferase family protein [Desmospora profundinema]MDR6225111.1 glutamate-1-semialdehyde 2,1-aminomutase [Desmospora profundinema]
MATPAKPVPPLLEKTSQSARLFEEAAQCIPGGITANIKHFDPYPLFMESASGARMRDVDGNEYIDYNLCYGALMLGHGHPGVRRAVAEQWETMGSFVFGAPHALEAEMARKLIDLYPGIELIRFTNSGLEATMLAVRLARGWTEKRKIAKFEGHYHGGYDPMLINVQSRNRKRGERPRPVVDSRGVLDEYQDQTVVLPFNDWEASLEILEEEKNDLAGVILEPVQGGFIPPDPVFLRSLREWTNKQEIPLIFDEVKTGFRLGLSGAQGRYGITPDLTTLGKVLGGGFPVGAVGGRRAILETASPVHRGDVLSGNENQTHSRDVLFHSGTYNGHPTVLAAGLATISHLEYEGVFAKVEEATRLLRNGMEEILARWGCSGSTLGDGTIFNVMLSEQPVQNGTKRDAAYPCLRRELDIHLLERGIYIKPMNRFSLSTAHTPDVVAETLDRFEEGVKRLTGKE